MEKLQKFLADSLEEAKEAAFVQDGKMQAFKAVLAFLNPDTTCQKCGHEYWSSKNKEDHTC